MERGGYFDSPWPCEDGGPRRLLAPRGPGFGLRPGERLVAASRPCFMANMVVLREPGEVYVQGSTGPGPTDGAFVERIHPDTLEPLARSPELPSGGQWWPGSVAVHRDGFLHVVHGRFAHRLDPHLRVVASRELPRERPYNGFVVLADGRLVTKSFVRDGSARSWIVVLHPETLAPACDELEMPEGSIARLSSDGEHVYVVGDHSVFRYRWTGLELLQDDDWVVRYRTAPDAEQSYGWDPVLALGHAWFLDNGANDYQGSLRGRGTASGPLHLVRVGLDAPYDHEAFTPFGQPHGTVVNPPCVDETRRIVVAYDSGNAAIAGFHFEGPGRFTPLWRHDGFGASTHFVLFPDTGELVVNDFQEDGGEHVVVLDVDSGVAKGRVAIGSTLQAVVFQAPGFARDVYTCTFDTLARVRVE